MTQTPVVAAKLVLGGAKGSDVSKVSTKKWEARSVDMSLRCTLSELTRLGKVMIPLFLLAVCYLNIEHL